MLYWRTLFGDVAQLGEHRLCKPGVEGSSPFVSTRYLSGPALCGLRALRGGVASLDPRASLGVQRLAPRAAEALRFGTR